MTKLTTIVKARHLRQEETKVEKILWEKLRNRKLGLKFRRQHPIDMYILDFYVPEIKFGIELDGSIHNIKENKEYDKERTEYLRSKNIKILRFQNSEIENNLDMVLNKIKEKIKELSI
ncbi:MAG: endonuclease domain-containing protein [Candidatus Paceibacterota bacterium]